MTILSFWLYKDNKWLTILSLLTVFGMGFQAWLGKTVVDSNLASFKITVHMVMALVIVAVLLLIIFKASNYTVPAKVKKQFFIVLSASIVLTLIQIIMGTQVRHDVDEQVKIVGYDSAYLWLKDPSWRFYTHRSFSFLVLATNLYLWFSNRKNGYKLHKLNWIILLIMLEILTGVIMYYFDFPFGSQPIHLVIASLLFAVQFYVLLEAIKAVRSNETL
jgi:cytochrome c oxidase assembly protein subunit 15